MISSDTAKSLLQSQLRSFKGTKQDWYRNVYLFSDHWLTLRSSVLRQSNNTCSHCGLFNPHLDVHHENYRNIYDVTPSDLKALCRKCHEAIHAAKTHPYLDVPKAVKIPIIWTDNRLPHDIILKVNEFLADKSIRGSAKGRRNHAINRTMDWMTENGYKRNRIEFVILKSFKSGKKGSKARKFLSKNKS